MRSLRLLNAAEQVAAHLQEEVRQQSWGGKMPGAKALALELGVNHKTVKAALALLVRDGVLVGQGARRRHQIHPSDVMHSEQKLRVAILVCDPPDKSVAYMVEMQHLLMEAGHRSFFAPGSLVELGMNVRRVARMVEKTEADAWIVCSGSREVLEWFSAQPLPAFALFGRRRRVTIAGSGPDHMPALLAATRRLIELGHKRIVLLEREGRRAGEQGQVERTVFTEMEAHGLSTGPYNLPEWGDTPQELRRCLDTLFKFTAPTALIIDEAFLFTAVQQHLARRGILAPEHVSLVCIDSDPTFAWCEPSIAHIRWDTSPVVRQVVRWVDLVARRNDSRRQSFTKAEFVDGGTIGPVRWLTGSE